MTKQDIAFDNEILRGIVGSTAHGTAIDGQDDRDEMGVFIEPPENVCGLSPIDHYIYRSQPEGMRSGPGDLDLTLYSLRKFCHLATQGNPSVIILLWLPEHITCTKIGKELIKMRQAFISRESGKRFLGYLTAQKMKLNGERSKKVNRPELVEKYGFDCYSDDTEFLTQRGWLPYDAISDGKPLATVNQITREIEFQIPTERVSKDYAGPMLEIKHRYSNCLVTPNHRMFVSPTHRGPSGCFGTAYRPECAGWSFMRADDLPNRDWFHIQVRSAPRHTPDYAVSDAHIALVGMYVSEGCVSKRRNSGSASVLAFTQNVGGRAEQALALIGNTYPLRSYAYEPREGKCPSKIYTMADRSLAARIAVECGEGSYSKRLPPWAFRLSDRQSRLLLDTLMAGDGTHKKNCRIYYTVSAQLAGDVQAIALLAGYRANVWGPYETGMYQVFIRDGHEHQAISTRVNLISHAAERRRVVCFTVPNETLVTRRNGRVAMHGNTKFAMHALRLGFEGIEMLTHRRLTLPVAEPNLSTLRAVRGGEVNKEEALRLIEAAEQQLRGLVDDCEWEADRKAINRFMVKAHMAHWSI